MDRGPNVILVGPMGAGKSTIGRQLARSLGYEFRDSDQELETRTGVRIPVIFEYEGEAGFRQRERAVIDELTGLSGVVLATGGGAVLDADNRARLAGRGYVVYLRTSVEQQLARVGHDRNRPLIQTDDPRARLASLLAERDPLYRQVADLVVDTDGKTVRAVAKDILRRLRREPAFSSRS